MNINRIVNNFRVLIALIIAITLVITYCFIFDSTNKNPFYNLCINTIPSILAVLLGIVLVDLFIEKFVGLQQLRQNSADIEEKESNLPNQLINLQELVTDEIEKKFRMLQNELQNSENNVLKTSKQELLGHIQNEFNATLKNVVSYIVRNPPNLNYDYFISIPMSSIDKDEFDSISAIVLSIIEKLEENHKTVFCGLKRMTGREYGKWNAPESSAKEGFEALIHSKKYILIYPEKVASSVLIEAGIAIAYKKNCNFLIKSGVDLPYTIRQYPDIDIETFFYDSPSELTEIIVNRA